MQGCSDLIGTTVASLRGFSVVFNCELSDVLAKPGLNLGLFYNCIKVATSPIPKFPNPAPGKNVLMMCSWSASPPRRFCTLSDFCLSRCF